MSLLSKIAHNAVERIAELPLVAKAAPVIALVLAGAGCGGGGGGPTVPTTPDYAPKVEGFLNRNPLTAQLIFELYFNNRTSVANTPTLQPLLGKVTTWSTNVLPHGQDGAYPNGDNAEISPDTESAARGLLNLNNISLSKAVDQLTAQFPFGCDSTFGPYVGNWSGFANLVKQTQTAGLNNFVAALGNGKLDPNYPAGSDISPSGTIIDNAITGTTTPPAVTVADLSADISAAVAADPAGNGGSAAAAVLGKLEKDLKGFTGTDVGTIIYPANPAAGLQTTDGTDTYFDVNNGVGYLAVKSAGNVVGELKLINPPFTEVDGQQFTINVGGVNNLSVPSTLNTLGNGLANASKGVIVYNNNLHGSTGGNLAQTLATDVTAPNLGDLAVQIDDLVVGAITGSIKAVTVLNQGDSDGWYLYKDVNHSNILYLTEKSGNHIDQLRVTIKAGAVVELTGQQWDWGGTAVTPLTSGSTMDKVGTAANAADSAITYDQYPAASAISRALINSKAGIGGVPAGALRSPMAMMQQQTTGMKKNTSGFDLAA